MVEPQIVVLVVAGSSPVGHPALRKSKFKFITPVDLMAATRDAFTYYNRVFANGIEPAPRLSGYGGVFLSF